MTQFLMILAILTSALTAASIATGQTQDAQVDEAREAEISQKVKKRLYPGGRDEEDLRVQAELVTPSRKMAPQAEVKEEDISEE